MRLYALLLSLWFVCLQPAAVGAAGRLFSLWRQDTLSGDWAGYRSRFADHGITFEAVYTGEMFSNVSGGIRQKTVYLDNIDLTLTVDVERLLGWPGARLFLYGLGNRGGNPSEHIGDAQAVSNIEAFDTWKLFEAWFEQSLFDERVSLLVGLYDLNAEFDYIETAQLFLHSSFGIGADFSQSGQNGPSIFPTSSLGARLRLQPSPAWYWQTVVLDGVPGDPTDPNGTQIIFGANDGVLVTTEIAYLRGGQDASVAYGKYALGGWLYTADFDDLIKTDAAGQPARRGGSHGLYGFAEQTVFRETADLNQGLAVFVRLGLADTKVNQFRGYTGGGGVYTGLLPRRPTDRFGLGVAAVHNSGRYQRFRRNAGRPVDGAEVTLELTYRAELTPWFAVQPNFQYVINPSTEPTLANAAVFGLRFEVAF